MSSRLRTPLIIAGIALLLRLLVACIAYAGRDLVTMLWPRGVEALGIARSLLTGQGFSSPFSLPTGPTAFLPPIYPLILAAIERAFGLATPASAWAILFVQCFFSALVCVAIYFLATETLGEAVAKRAAWIWALFPYAIILPTNIIWESSLSALVLVVALYLFIRSETTGSINSSLLTGALWALASLVNAALLLLLPALLISSLVRRRLTARFAVCAVASFAFFLLPWAVRNYLVFHKIFPVRDNFGLELWIGNHQGAINGWMPQIHPAFSGAELMHYQEVGELRYMQEKSSAAKEYIRVEPGLFFKTSFLRCGTFWLGNQHALWLGIPFLTALAAVGVVLIFIDRSPWAGSYLLVLLVYPIPYYVTHSDLKYRHPIEPILAILSGYAITAVQRRRRWNPQHEQTPESLVNQTN